MTALDQAFIKAFTQQDMSPLTATPLPAAQGLEQSSLCREEHRDEEGTSTTEVRAEADKEREADNEEPRSPADGTSVPSPMVQSSSFVALAEPSQSPIASSVATSESVLAALEKPPRAVTGPLKAKNQPREFKPAWQVDHFTWPRVCRRLIARAAEELDRFADALLALNARGQKVLAIGGCHRGEGATTLLLCAARRLAERGIKPVLVDADLHRPQLAKRLAVQPQFGWDETTADEERSLDQAIVEATANNLALLPAREPATDSERCTSDPSRLSACLRILRDHYDMVLVDPGPLDDAQSADGILAQTAAEMIDAVILVHNPRITSEEQLLAFEQQLAAVGIAAAGIVENFVAE